MLIDNCVGGLDWTQNGQWVLKEKNEQEKVYMQYAGWREKKL